MQKKRNNTLKATGIPPLLSRTTCPDSNLLPPLFYYRHLPILIPVGDNLQWNNTQALKNQWETEVRKSHVDGRLGATISGKLVGLGLGGGGGGGLAGATGAAREACLLAAFEKAVMRLWPAFCHIDAQRRRASTGIDGAKLLGTVNMQRSTSFTLE